MPSNEPNVVATGPFRPRANVKPAPTGDTRSRLLTLSGATGGQPTARIHEGPADEAAALAHAQLVEWGYVDEPPADA